MGAAVAALELLRNELLLFAGVGLLLGRDYGMGAVTELLMASFPSLVVWLVWALLR